MYKFKCLKNNGRFSAGSIYVALKKTNGFQMEGDDRYLYTVPFDCVEKYFEVVK